jgi:hypothetical protein
MDRMKNRWQIKAIPGEVICRRVLKVLDGARHERHVWTKKDECSLHIVMTDDMHCFFFGLLLTILIIENPKTFEIRVAWVAFLL